MKLSTIDRLPQSTRDHIRTMRQNDGTQREIHEWILAQGHAHVTFAMLQHWCIKHVRVMATHAFTMPATTPEERLAQYVGAILAANIRTYTLRRLGLHGVVWGACTFTLKHAGLIESDNPYGSRHRVIVPLDELRAWLDNRQYGKRKGDN